VTLLRMLNGLPGLRPASIAPRTRLIASFASVGTGLTTHGGKFGLVLPIRQAILPAKPSQSSQKRAGSLLRFQFRSASLSEFPTGSHLRYYK
jgi:hypothetical protein